MTEQYWIYILYYRNTINVHIIIEKNYYKIFKYKIHKHTKNTKIKIQMVVKTINLLLLKEYKNIYKITEIY